MALSAHLKQQADELVRRGAAEARHGNRAAATALLRRAVRLDPQHEGAWVWLGAVAQPEEAAFSLRTALALNPNNRGARQGLHELEASGRLRAAAAPAVQRRPDHRWRRWRESRATARALTRALWAIPVVLLAVTLGLRVALSLGWPPAPQPPPAPRLEAKSARVVPTPPALAFVFPPPQATPVPLPTRTPRGAIATYFATIDESRRALREATSSYLQDNARRTTAERAAATRLLRDAVQGARERLGEVTAPAEARAAHALYLSGLARETEALDDVLAFYVEYNLARSNSAALRMQQARAAIGAAVDEWNALAGRYGLTLAPAADR